MLFGIDIFTQAEMPTKLIIYIGFIDLWLKFTRD